MSDLRDRIAEIVKKDAWIYGNNLRDIETARKTATAIMALLDSHPPTDSLRAENERLRELLDVGHGLEAPEVYYEPKGRCFFVEWIVKKGWRLAATLYDDGGLAWAALLGGDQRKGTDMEGLIAARQALQETEND